MYNNINSTITLSAGTYLRSQESSVSGEDDGGNSYYVLKNFGTMKINGTTVVKFSDSNSGFYSSLIGNGWQDSTKAENGSNEPKPSEGNHKATLNIESGNFYGGKIVVKNDDYGVLKITGGNIEQKTESYYAVFNANSATVSGGTIISENGVAIGNNHYDGEANAGSITISGGTFSSGKRVIDTNDGSKLEITGGSFYSTSEESYLINATEGSAVSISGGTFKCDDNKLSNKTNIFKEGYAPQKGDNGDLIIKEDPNESEAKVEDIDGNVKYYLSLSSALSNATNGSTITLLKDVTLTKSVSSKNYGITLDMNGYSIDGSSVKAGNSVIKLGTNYGAKPTEGMDNTMTIINHKNTGGEIKGDIPVEFRPGNSKFELPADIKGNVKLISTSGKDPIVLGSSAYLLYTDSNASYFTNGMFKVTGEDGTERIYGSYANAAKKAFDHNITLLNDYIGNDSISSGSASTTLDLNGHTYHYNGSDVAIDINYPNVKLTIKNGTIISNGDGVHLIGAGSGSDQENNRSIVMDNVDLTVNGDYGIITNGTEENNNIELIDSTLTVENGHGIYFPSSGTVRIDNSKIDAKYVGVQMCAGNLHITGEETSISTTSESISKTENDGAISDGAAISIVKRDGYKKLETVVIENGTFTSEKSEAIKTYTFNNNDKTEGEWSDSSNTVDIKGGSYSDISPIKNLSSDAEIDIMLHNDVELSDGEVINIPSTSKVSIDLNGHNIEAENTNDPSIKVYGELDLLNSSTQGKANVKVLIAEDGCLNYDARIIDQDNIIVDNTSYLISSLVKNDVDGVTIDQSEIVKIRTAIENLINDNKYDGLKFDDPSALSEIKAAHNDGSSIWIEIEISNDVDSEAKDSILRKYPSSSKFFDISIYVVVVDDDKNTAKYKVDQLPSKVYFDVEISEEMEKEDRDYYVVREHNGSIDKIGYLRDLDQDGKLELSSDRFSVYAIAYETIVENNDRPSYRPSSPSKDLPSNTKECQKEFGDEYIWSDEYDACVIKFMIVDTSTR